MVDLTLNIPIRSSALLLASALLLSGCVTMQDFQRMSPHQRAMTVCDNQPDIRNLRSEVQGYEQAISEASVALRRGYRSTNECRKEEVQVGTRTECRTLEYGVECEERALWETRTRCTESRQSINAALERSNISAWRGALRDSQALLAERHQQCYHRIYPMSAAQAFDQYRGR